MPIAAARTAKRVAGDIVTHVFEVGDVMVGLGLHKVPLTKSHVALNGSDVTLEGIELGLRSQQGVAKVAHADNLGIQTGMFHRFNGIAKKSVAQGGPKQEMVEPGGEGSDALALQHQEIVQKLASFSAFLSSKAKKWPSWYLVI
jgi:hypothetical protein